MKTQDPNCLAEMDDSKFAEEMDEFLKFLIDEGILEGIFDSEGNVERFRLKDHIKPEDILIEAWKSERFRKRLGIEPGEPFPYDQLDLPGCEPTKGVKLPGSVRVDHVTYRTDFGPESDWQSSPLIKGIAVACYSMVCGNCYQDKEAPEMGPGWRKTVRMQPLWGEMEWTGKAFIPHFFDDPHWYVEQEEYTHCPKCGVRLIFHDPDLPFYGEGGDLRMVSQGKSKKDGDQNEKIMKGQLEQLKRQLSN